THEITPSETLISVDSNDVPQGDEVSKWEQLTDKYPLLMPVAVACGIAFTILGIAGFMLSGNRPADPPVNPNNSAVAGKTDKAESSDKKAKSPFAKAPVEEETAKANVPIDFSKPVNLLKLIDVKRDAATPGWQTEGTGLVVPTSSNARLQIPVVPP